MKKVLRLLLPYVLPYWPLAIGSVLLSLILASIRMGQTYILKPLIDNGIQEDTNLDKIIFLVGIIMALAIVNVPIRFFHFYWIRYVVDKATCDIRSQIYRKIQEIPLIYFLENKRGELLSSLLNDTHVFAHGIRALIDLIREPLTAFSFFLLILYLDWQLALVVIAAMPLFIFILKKTGERVRRTQGLVQENISAMTHSIGEGIQGQRVIKAFGIQDYMLQTI